MTALMIEQFICRQDNFCVLLHDPLTGDTACIDAPDGAAIRQSLKESKWKLTHLLITHHHHDHVAGISKLKDSYEPRIIGPADEADKIDGLTSQLSDGDTFKFAGRSVHVISTPGHTAGHICFYIPDENLLFAGDTLFALGCGRLFEGSPADMFTSLGKLSQLPDETRIYCGHEYTLSNANFAMTVDPENKALAARTKDIIEMRKDDIATLPSTISFEKRTNPFLRTSDPDIRELLDMQDATDLEVFTELRHRKDNF